MKVKDYPECFGSYKIYDVVRKVMLNYNRQVDVEKIITQTMGSEATPEDFLKKMALISKRHMNVTKSSKMILDIKEELSKLIGVHLDPKEITISKKGKDTLRVYVENKTDATFKFQIGVQQIDRKYTPILYNPVTNATHMKILKGHPIAPGKVYVFKFIIRPDIFGIEDLYELNKSKKIRMSLGMQVKLDGVTGIKTPLHKLNVNILKMIT